MYNQEINTMLLEMDKICRICLKIGEMKSIYEKIKYSEDDLTIASLLTESSVIQISEEDGLPTQICIKCTKEINNCYFFIKKCQLSDEILRKYVKEYAQEEKQISIKDKQINTDIEVISETENEEDLSFIEPIDISCFNGDSITIQNEELYNSFVLQENNSVDNNDEVKLKSKLLNSENITDYQTVEHKNESDVKVVTIECKSCSISFETHKELLKHNQTKEHRMKKYSSRIPCEICHEPIRWRYMTKHKRIHTKEKPYKCQLCDARFTIGSNLRRHTRAQHTNERPFTCKFCQRGFTQLVLLRYHVRTHTGEKPYVCNYCTKTFARPCSLRSHLIMHAQKDEDGVDKKLNYINNCDLCGRKFRTRALLTAHLAVHAEKKFLCSDCGKRFVTLVQLQSHSKIHTGARPYCCAECGKSFAHVGSLKSHSLIHSGQKPFVCKVCNRAFTQSAHLRYHLRTHSGERPYSCRFCGKSFALNGNLTVHLRTHTGETPYLCPTCGKGFYDSSSMKKHHRGHK